MTSLVVLFMFAVTIIYLFVSSLIPKVIWMRDKISDYLDDRDRKLYSPYDGEHLDQRRANDPKHGYGS